MSVTSCDDVVLDTCMDVAAVSGEEEDGMESEAEEFEWPDEDGEVLRETCRGTGRGG